MDSLESTIHRNRFATTIATLWTIFSHFIVLNCLGDVRRKMYTTFRRCSKTEIADTAVILAADWPACHAPGTVPTLSSFGSLNRATQTSTSCRESVA